MENLLNSWQANLTLSVFIFLLLLLSVAFHTKHITTYITITMYTHILYNAYNIIDLTPLS